MSFLSGMQKWTPATVLTLLVVAVLCFALLWYSIHFQEPPLWLLTAIGVAGGGGLFGAGQTAGVNSATTAAQATGNAVAAAASALPSTPASTPASALPSTPASVLPVTPASTKGEL
jgi:hypothetical protein